MNAMRILLADQQEHVRYSMRVLLRQQSRWKVIGEAENAADLVALAGVLEPDLVVMDWDLPGMEPQLVVQSLRDMCSGIAVMIISRRIDVKSSALDAGADGFFCKGDPPDQLLETVFSLQKNEKNGDGE